MKETTASVETADKRRLRALQIERIFERIAVSLGEGLPRGAVWHVDLLTQMATEQVGNRSPVIDEPLHGYLQEYLKFRHFFRRLWLHVSVE